MQRRIVAEALAGQLFKTEEAVDSTLSMVADLVAAMPRARVEAGLSAAVGQDALDHALAAAAGMAQARRSLIAAHAALAAVKDEVGLRRVTLVGGGDKSDTDVPRTGQMAAVTAA